VLYSSEQNRNRQLKDVASLPAMAAAAFSKLETWRVKPETPGT
jgi:hypothetical protein